MTAIFFYLFATITVASAFMVISSRNPVHAVLFLILAFVNSAGLFMLTGAEFLALLLIVVYVGAVAVLFLFVVMMLDVDFVELREGFLQYLPIGGLVGFVVLAELLMVLGTWVFAPGAIGGTAAEPIPEHGGRVEYRGARQCSLHKIHLLLPGGGADPAGGDDWRDCADLASSSECAPPGHQRADRPHS